MSCLNKPSFSTSSTLPLSILSASTSKCSKPDSFFTDIIATLEDSSLCGSCEEGTSATSKCADCSEMLCDPCVRAHQRVRITKDHRIERFLNDLNIPHASAGSLGSSSRASSSPCNIRETYCDIHRESHRLYCESCTTTICCECSLTEPCGHPLIFMHEAFEIARKVNPKLRCEMLRAKLLVQASMETVQNFSEKIEILSHQTISEIRNVFRRSVSSLEERQNELIIHVEQIRQYKGKLLLNQMENLRLMLGRLLSASDTLDESIESSNSLDQLIAKDRVVNELRQLKEIGQLTPCEEPNITFIPPDASFLRIISSAGSIVSSNGRNKLVPKLNLNMKEWTPYLPGVAEANLFKNGLRNHPVYGLKKPVVVKNTGTVPSLCFGHEGEADGQLCRPWGICCNHLGQIIVADRSNNRIQVFNADGTFHHKFGNHGTNPGQFDRPAGVAINPNGELVVTDKDNHRIQVFKMDGTFVLEFGERGSRNGQFNYPWDVACNSQGHIVVSDTRNHRIQLFNSEGIFLNKYGFEAATSMWKHFDSPRGVCFTPTGSIIVTDFNNHRLIVIDSNFMQAQFLGQEGTNYKQFLRPQGIVCDDEGNIVVADSRNSRIQVFESNGNFLWKVGQAGKGGGGDMDRPSSVCLNPDGRIIVLDFGNNRVQMF